MTVSQLLAIAKEAIEAGTGPVWVTGELSGFKRHSPSGHLYFDLKDASARVSCVQWRDSARRIRFEPIDGMMLRAHGRLGIYETQGRLQLYVDSLEPAGIGELQAAFEAMKARLAAEGLFDSDRKKRIPSFPMRIGLATSPSGAAVRDVLRVLGERWPAAEVTLRPCPVQGAEAAEGIARALRDLDQQPDLDLVILARGGGSIEDLWAFNEEAVVRAVASMRLPIVTGIGHEIDTTLADLAADLRAATPSQAAELAVPQRTEIARRLASLDGAIGRHLRSQLSQARLRLQRLSGSHGMRRPVERLRLYSQRLDDLSARAGLAAAAGSDRARGRFESLLTRFRLSDPRLRVARSRERLSDLSRRVRALGPRRISDLHERLDARARHLEAVGPRAVLGRGYSICLRPEDGRAVRSAGEVEVGEAVRVVLGVGSLGCRVEERVEEPR